MNSTLAKWTALALVLGATSKVSGAVYTTLDPPGSLETQAFGVSGNSVVGYYGDGTMAHGFLYDGSSYTTLDPSGSLTTVATGVSGNNVVGYYSDGFTHGFLYQADSGVVPEPSTLIVWSLLGSVAIGLRFLRQKPGVCRTERR